MSRLREEEKLLYTHCPAEPNIENMIKPGKMLDRPRITAARAPPVMPPEMALALTRSPEDGAERGVVHVASVAVRTVQKVVPMANICSPDKPAKRRGATPVLEEPPNLSMPAAPPSMKPPVPLNDRQCDWSG